MSENEYTERAFLTYVQKARSKNTYIMYVQGLKKFAEWYGKSIDEILKERRNDLKSDDLFRKKRFAQKIEEFHADLVKRGHTPSTASTHCQGIRTIFTYYEMPVKVSGAVDKRVMSTKDVVPRIDQYQAMYKSASDLRDKLIISMGLNLAWRIGDFLAIRKDMLPNLEQRAPIPFELITEKEDVLAKSFLSAETVELLKEYLETIKDNPNPYLFPSNGEGHIDATTVNRTLRALAEKSGVQIPNGKRVRFHAFRKRFLSECANLRIDVNIAKILCGKDVEKSMLAYLSEVDLNEAFIRLSERLRTTEKKAVTMTNEKETQLEKRIDELERLMHAVIALGGKDLIARAKEMLKLDVTMTMTKQQLIDALKQIGEKEWREQQKEYERIITENNGNGDNGNGE